MADEDWYRQIHERLLAGDPVAPGQLAEAVWNRLVKTLEAKYPRLPDRDVLRDAASDALLSYLKRPTQFDPTKRGLFGFLVMAAEGDLRNALAKTARRTRNEVSLEDVELPDASGKEKREVPDPQAPIMAQRIHLRIGTLFSDPKDREAVELLIEGERSTSAFAKLWGLESLPAKDQAREVKRHKDRIKKTLQRHGGQE
jgi:RNA polymerase sigma-70 factor (ECF subfamily)